jgi:hypothetical protein
MWKSANVSLHNEFCLEIDVLIFNNLFS